MADGFELRVRLPSGEQWTHELTGTSVTVGRDPGADLVIADASVSRAHARLTFTGSGWIVTDLGSSNGLWLDGQRINETPLAPGQPFRLGDTEFVLLAPAPSDPAQTQQGQPPTQAGAPAPAPVFVAAPPSAAPVVAVAQAPAAEAPALTPVAQPEPRPRRRIDRLPQALLLLAGVAAVFVVLGSMMDWGEADIMARILIFNINDTVTVNGMDEGRSGNVTFPLGLAGAAIALTAFWPRYVWLRALACGVVGVVAMVLTLDDLMELEERQAFLDAARTLAESIVGEEVAMELDDIVDSRSLPGVFFVLFGSAAWVLFAFAGFASGFLLDLARARQRRR